VKERDWVGELSNYLQHIFRRFCELPGQPPRSSNELRINPPLAVEEAKYFLLGLEHGLFRPYEEGYVRSDLLLYSGAEDCDQPVCQIFAHTPPPSRIVRESVCQLATASRLVFERGWLPNQIRIATGEPASHGVDMIVESDAGKTLVAVEVKRSEYELEKFANDFQQCCNRGEHPRSDCAFQQNHGLYEYCLRYEPPYLWAVAPGQDVCFELRCLDRIIELEGKQTLPPRSHIEFGSSQTAPVEE
jgi:hypothetical protein